MSVARCVVREDPICGTETEPRKNQGHVNAWHTTHQIRRVIACGCGITLALQGSTAHAQTAEEEPLPPKELPPLELDPAPKAPQPKDTQDAAAPDTNPRAPVDKPVPPAEPGDARPSPTDEAQPPADQDGKVYDLGASTVVGHRRQEATSASRYDVEIGKLSIIPRRNASEQLMLAPGVLTTNHGGEGHAHATFMRGFAAREGQDIEYTVDGVPLNEVSNPHGHGYSDLMFLPPEFVKSVNITEGPFDPAQGDFAFAGSANYRLGVPQRGTRLKYGLGRFRTQRMLLTYAPPELDDSNFAGFELYETGGYGPNRAAQRATALGRYGKEGGAGEPSYGLTAFGYAARYDQPGVVRQDDYERRRMQFFDTYDPNQGGESDRLLFTLHASFGPQNARFHQVTFLGHRAMRLRSNFTGWMTDTLATSGEVPGVSAQRGDGAESRYEVLTGGSRGHYALSTQALGHEQRLTVGYSLRYDHGTSSQRRLRAVTAIPYQSIFDRKFTIANVSGWAGLHLRPLRQIAIRSGVRVDAFGFGVTDLNQPTVDREGPRLGDQTSQSFGHAINPRTTVDLTLMKGLHFLASYGQGTRSTEAAALSDNERAPFALAHVADTGFTYSHGKEGGPFTLNSQLSYSYAHVNKDILFSETESRNVLIGASTRHAVLMGTRMTVGTWFDTVLNAGWAHATLDASGELIPYIPEWIVRADSAIGGQIANWNVNGVPTVGHLGVGFTYVPGRPLPRKEFGDPMYLTNVGGELRIWHFSLGLEVRNLLNMRYRQSEFNYASNFVGPNAPPTRVAERHFVAGEPLFAMASLTVHVEDLLHPTPEAKPAPAAGINQ